MTESESKSGKTLRRYSEALKLEVVSEIESGRHSVREAGIFYGIPSTTIADWVKKYGTATKNKIVEVVMKDQKDKIRELESALSDAHLKLKIYEKMIDIAKKEEGLELKKNTDSGEYKLVRKKKERA